MRKVEDGHTAVIEDSRFVMLLDRATDGACVVWLCAGERVRDWHQEMERRVGEFARARGCDRLRIEGRKGWVRALPHWTKVAEHDGEVTLELAI